MVFKTHLTLKEIDDFLGVLDAKVKKNHLYPAPPSQFKIWFFIGPLPKYLWQKGHLSLKKNICGIFGRIP